MNEQLAELAAEGYSEFKIASVLGLKVVTVKEMLGLEEIKELIIKFRARPKEDITNRKYERIEDLALKTIEDNLAMAELPDALKVLDTITKRRLVEQSKGNNTGQPLVGSISIVNISLPERLVPEQNTTMTLNENGEIIAVGGRSFAPLSAPGVQEIFSKIALKRKVMRGVTAEDL